MTFVFPWFLWALLATAVPIIIHLFNFRRYKKVYFTNVKFLKELHFESKSKSRLKELLVLIMRCAIIICLVLAFAQPVIYDKQVVINKGVQAVSIYIDNSFSTQNVNKQGPVIQIAKARAKDIIRAFGNADKFQVITNDFEGRHQRFNTKEDAFNAVDEIKVTPVARSLSEVLSRQANFLNASNHDNKKIYLLSDAQRSTFNLSEAQVDTTIKTTIVPIETNRVNNVLVDSCWFETPLQQKGFIQKLHARIVNNGTSGIEAGSAKLYLNKQQVAIASFSMDAGAERDIQFTFECKQEGYNFGSIKIEDYPITFDDELFFSFNSKLNISVVLINGKDQKESNPLNTLFKNDILFNLKAYSEQSIDYSALNNADVVVLNQLNDWSSGFLAEITKFTKQGGSLLIIPSLNTEPQLFNAALNSLHLPQSLGIDTSVLKVDKIDLASKFFSNVFDKTDERMNLPLVNKHFKLNKSNANAFESIMTLQNGETFFGELKTNGSSVYLFTTPFEVSATNFNKHALFVPTLYRVCFNSLRQNPLFYLVSSNVVLYLKSENRGEEQPPVIKELNGVTEIIPERRVVNNAIALYTRDQVTRPGFYTVTKADSACMPLAFNYPRRESYLEAYSSDELENTIAKKGWHHVNLIKDSLNDISGQVFETEQGRHLWKLFIILALLFILSETLILRLLK